MSNAESNPISFLQEFVVKYNAGSLPQYLQISSCGPSHDPVFTYKCIYNEFETIGKSSQKKNAKTEAASEMVKLLKQVNYFERFGVIISNGYVIEQNPITTITSTCASKNCISALQEYCQKIKIGPPLYIESSPSLGNFICECSVLGSKTYGQGTNKKGAKTEAAALMCTKLGLDSGVEESVKNDTLGSVSINKDQNDVDTSWDGNKTTVSALQEYCAKKHIQPLYVEKGLTPDKQFIISCTLGKITAEGKGSTKKLAKHAAALLVIKQLQQENKMMKTDVDDYQNASFSSTVSMNVSSSNSHLTHSSILEEFNPDEEEDKSDADSNNVTNGLANMNLNEHCPTVVKEEIIDDTVEKNNPEVFTEETSVETESQETSAEPVPEPGVLTTPSSFTARSKTLPITILKDPPRTEGGLSHSPKSPVSEQLLHWRKQIKGSVNDSPLS